MLVADHITGQHVTAGSALGPAARRLISPGQKHLGRDWSELKLSRDLLLRNISDRKK